MTGRLLPVLTRRLDSPAPPLALFRALTDEGTRPHTVLLESAEPESRRHQRSLLVVSAALRITCRHDAVTIAALKPEAQALLRMLQPALAGLESELSGPELRVANPRSPDVTADIDRLRAPSALDVLRVVARTLRTERGDLPESLLLAGLMSYDMAGLFETLPAARAAGLPVPLYEFYLADRIVIVDHLLMGRLLNSTKRSSPS